MIPEDFDLPIILDPNVTSPPRTGTVDDDDDPNHEWQGENEAPVRELNERMEAPDEFEKDEDEPEINEDPVDEHDPVEDYDPVVGVEPVEDFDD